MSIKVIKLGGTSQNIIPYTNAKKVITDLISKQQKVFIVVSALSGITNLLLDETISSTECKKNLISRHTSFIEEFQFDKDYITNLIQYVEFIINYVFKAPFDTENRKIEKISLGEHLSSVIFNAFINYPENKHIIKSNVVMATNLLKYNSTLKNLNNLIVDTNQIIKQFKKYNVLVTQGFVASDVDNNPTILMGRGSSDTSGAVFAKYLKANEYQIWTDVACIYNIDPRLVDNATKITHLDFEMAQEMAGMGAKILHPYCIKPCQKNNIPISIINSFNIDEENTTIDSNPTETISFLIQKDINIIKIKSIDMWHGIGFAADIFNTFSINKLDIDIIITSPFEITVTVKKDGNFLQIKNAISQLEERYCVELFENYHIVSVVSNNILLSGKLSKIHEISSKYDIKLESVSSNNYSISFGLKENSIEFLLELYNL